MLAAHPSSWAAPWAALAGSLLDSCGRSPRFRMARARRDSSSRRAHGCTGMPFADLLREGAVAQVVERALQFLRRVHDDRAIPGHRLLDRLAGHEQEADSLIAG